MPMEKSAKYMKVNIVLRLQWKIFSKHSTGKKTVWY